MKDSINMQHQKLQFGLAEDMDKFVQSEYRREQNVDLYDPGYVARSRYPQLPKSPSTDSTTSLAQLHDKLNALPPVIYTKVPQKISATPELPTVREVSETDDLSDPLSKRTRFGVASYHKSINKANLSLAKKYTSCQNVMGYQSESEVKTPLVKRLLRGYQSDTEAKTVVKKTRCISPVNKEKTPSVLLVATLGTSDESVINDTFDKLCKDNPKYDLLELLVEEALQNDQEKDSGVCSKRTQETDFIENTPIEKNVHRKKLNITKSKQTVVSNSATDESTTDVIDDTPCYVNDRKKRVQTNTIKKGCNVITEDVNTCDDVAVDTFFSQHMNENNGSIYISPTLAKKINETSSEASDDDLANFTFLHGEYFNVLSIFAEVVDKDIVDCLNNILDKVCNDLDECTDLMNEKHQHIEVLSKVQHFDESSSVTSDVPKTKNNISRVDDFETVSEDSKKNTLKFNFSKKRAPKMNKKQQKLKNYKQPVKVHKESVIIGNKNVKSPEHTNKTILTRKKRKLYSPKDGDNDNHEITRITRKDETRQSVINQTPIATCYKELEKARRSRIRLPRKSRASTEPITSPKSKKYNDLFDKIKENVENEEIVTLAEKSGTRNKKDLTLYNLSSESEDQDFQEKKIKVQKRVSSSSLESSAKKRSRVVKPHQFSDLEFRDLCSSEDESKMIKTRKTIKETKPRSRKVRREQNDCLIDERMRLAPPEVLEISFIKETANEKKADVVEPAIQEAPVSEIISDDNNDVITEDIVPENKSLTPKKIEISKENNENVSKKNNKAENKARIPKTLDILKIKKEKGINKKIEKAVKSLVTKRGRVTNKQEINTNVSKGRDSATVSPLPGLVVETEQLHKDDITSSIEANLLQKFKNIYTEVHDLSDTQNSLLNAHNNNDAYGDVGFNEHIETLQVSDNSTERSIATVGRSPITAHNDLNEMPPNVELLDEQFLHRDVNREEISRDMAEFLDTMRSKFNCSRRVTMPVATSPVLPMTRTPSKRSIKKQNTTSAESNATVPVVVLKRLSTEEIESNLNPVVTPSQTSQISSGKVLSRKSSVFIEKYRSPHTKTSSSTKSLQIILDRLSSDDINKWLPIPQFTCNDAINNKVPKKSKKQETMKTLTGVTKTTHEVQENKFKSPNSPSSYKTQQQKLKSITSVTPDTPQEKRFKSMISPVKLDFDCLEKTDRCLLKRYNTRSSIKSIKSRATKVERINDGEIRVSQKSSNTATTEKCAIAHDEKKTQTVTSVNTTELMKDKSRRLAVESEVKIANSSDNTENTARVQDWFKRNVSAITSGKADNAAVKDVLAKVTEILDTTLTEMHQSTHEKLIHDYLENQKRFTAFEQDVCMKLAEMKKLLMEGAYKMLREDAEKKALLLRLLQEDIQATIDFVDKADK